MISKGKKYCDQCELKMQQIFGETMHCTMQANNYTVLIEDNNISQTSGDHLAVITLYKSEYRNGSS